MGDRKTCPAASAAPQKPCAAALWLQKRVFAPGVGTVFRARLAAFFPQSARSNRQLHGGEQTCSAHGNLA